jgi:hypothetical protein
MWVEFNASQVYDPGKTRSIVNYKFLRCTPRWKRECYRAKPRGAISRRSLLVERLTIGAVDEAF